MTRVVFLRHQRFEKGRRRVFTVAVWKVVRGLSRKVAPMWGAELAEARKAVEAMG